MKKIILLATTLLFIVTSFSQTTPHSTFSKNYYLQKSKTQKTIAWIMLGGGTAMAITGFLIENKKLTEGSFNVIEDTGPQILILGGTGVALGSIPFFISSAKNKRRAASVSFETKNNLLMQQNNFVYKIQPSVTLKIGL